MQCIVIESFKGVDQSYYGPFASPAAGYDWIDSRIVQLLDEPHPYHDSFTHRVISLRGV
jgi:hypothetical protein